MRYPLACRARGRQPQPFSRTDRVSQISVGVVDGFLDPVGLRLELERRGPLRLAARTPMVDEEVRATVRDTSLPWSFSIIASAMSMVAAMPA